LGDKKDILPVPVVREGSHLELVEEQSQWVNQITVVNLEEGRYNGGSGG